MKFLRTAILGIGLLCAGSVAASSKLENDHILTTDQNIIVHSSKGLKDVVTAITKYGTFGWDVEFKAAIVSMKIKDDALYVYSKGHYGDTSYLHCIELHSGHVLWHYTFNK